MPFMELGRRRRAMMVEGYRAHLGLQVGGVGMQMCGFPRWSGIGKRGGEIFSSYVMHGMTCT
jgi:hypothetical protein